MRRTMPLMCTEPASLGFLGSVTSYCRISPLLQGFGAVPPLVTDIDLSMDDKFLYVACWGTGEMRQYDVTDPRKPKFAGLGAYRRHCPPHASPNGKNMRVVRRW